MSLISTGTFGAATKNPILFISNTVDPATPIEKSVSSISTSNLPVLTAL